MAGVVDLDAILAELGQFGKYQMRNYCLILVAIVFSAMYNCQYIFAAGAVDYRCHVPECELEPPRFNTNGWGAWALPDYRDRCDRMVPLGEECVAENFSVNETQPCTAWVYASNHTIVETFQLACQEWRRTLVGTVHSCGTFVAMIFIGHLSDSYGRRVALVLTAVAPALVGTLRAFSNTYIMYIFLEFLEAVVAGGVYTTSFVLALEMVGPKKRVVAGTMISATFATGEVITALVAWAVPHWRHFTIAIYTPSILFITYYWLIQESVRWLLSKNRIKEAAKIIFRAADVNKKKLSPEFIKILTDDEPLEEKEKPRAKSNTERAILRNHVLKSRTIVTRFCICSFWWITLTFVYYGLSINSVSLAGNMYANYILTALVEIPGYYLSAITMNRFGRKTSIITAFFICGASLSALPFIPTSISWLQTALNLLAKMFISMAFSSTYIYTGELFPTQARHTLLGACSMFGRIGSIVAPQTPLLMVYMESLPYLIFGAMAFTAGALMFLTPETLGIKLPDTVEEAENIQSVKKKQNIA